MVRVRQFGRKLEVAGVVPAEAVAVLRHDEAKRGTTFLPYEAGRPVAAECVNRPADFMAARSAIRAGSSIDPARAEDVGVPLKSLVSGLVAIS